MSNHSFDRQVSPETYLCHGPFDPDVFGGVVNPPVYHASTVIFKTCKELSERHQALFEDAEDEVMYYGRFGTPITFAVQKALAELERLSRVISADRPGGLHQRAAGAGKKRRSYSGQQQRVWPDARLRQQRAGEDGGGGNLLRSDPWRGDC